MKKILRIAAVMIAALLAACGGGGGGGVGTSIANNTGAGGGNTAMTFSGTCPDGSNQSSSVSEADAVAHCAIPGNLSSTAPTPTYAAGTDSLHAFQVLNQARVSGGFGALTQTTALDTSASNHLQYVFANDYQPSSSTWNNAALDRVDPATGWIAGHVEIAGDPYFTGVLPLDRALAAGYPAFFVGEVMSPIYTASLKQGTYPGCVETLLATVFHRSGILNPELRNIGISIASSADGVANLCVIDPAFTSTNRAVPPSGWVAMYPPPQQTGVLTTILYGEAPDPVPTTTVKGNPVSVYVEPSKSLAVTSFTLTSGTGSAVAAKILTQTDFPQYLGANVAYLVPIQALSPNTTYMAHFAGTISLNLPGAPAGAPITRDWSFTTGPM